MRNNAFPSRRHHIAAARGGRCLLLGLALALALPLPGAAQTTRETERKLQKLRSELKGVAQERRQIEGQRGQASQQLREADEKVARTGRALAQTETALREQGHALAEAEQRRSTLQVNLAQQHRELAGLLRAAYQLGNHAPLKLLLSQDTVADANRALAYHRYLQRERAQRITTLTADLKELEALQAQIAERKQKLQGAQQDQKQQAAALEADRRDRAKTVASLDERFKDQREKEQALGQDAKALETLLANLRAAAARAEAERRAAARRAAAEKAAAERAARQAAAQGRPPPPTKVPPAVASAPAPKVGGLGWPLSGNLLARYGGKLPDGRTSSGVLIGAPAGSTVTAVADGTVVFSDWMTGYGMILIVDHGNGYMSLYAHNDTLLKDAGARVSRGDAVAKVGNSGGQGVTALYFELRRGGQPVNPDSWLQRR
ncbi:MULTISPECIES: murein hydrolase activator EnvC family protein [Stenotrophomonas maltophilia group]|uniref:murein hydrolase activator EnvC family protein n=1 Tax=Stenotrophomonas maltophilia group TaxID=995085 RepID=UPI000C25E2E0|nr:peptidoglycan DD-metalloendopeptidase family protein [Stenotrophomonas maltophilia]NED68387.1 peptidoglycan DD-metalloendopeptidase family protein [Streptomyces sp. SID10244]EKU9960659.1 peptidoglycan DD-metalloendopeptidase family protein [Stenotrophomonas maltophilia]EKU9986993.1 peptidoglycan DD-metalloendopeptidase family protein [Stenotrophomonas maltophilia]MBH1695449.1 peptidoglycan DD-metalloendopeptidase family protein [Stenotrophomonas maltophilia]MDG2510952.1 peptidoglycan DD-met